MIRRVMILIQISVIIVIMTMLILVIVSTVIGVLLANVSNNDTRHSKTHTIFAMGNNTLSEASNTSLTV